MFSAASPLNASKMHLFILSFLTYTDVGCFYYLSFYFAYAVCACALMIYMFCMLSC